MKRAKAAQAAEMMATKPTSLDIWLGWDTQKGEISWPSAAPRGFDKLMKAVAAVRPAGVNQRFE
jgi:hypothetical protein